MAATTTARHGTARGGAAAAAAGAALVTSYKHSLTAINVQSNVARTKPISSNAIHSTEISRILADLSEFESDGEICLECSAQLAAQRCARKFNVLNRSVFLNPLSARASVPSSLPDRDVQIAFPQRPLEQISELGAVGKS